MGRPLLPVICAYAAGLILAAWWPLPAVWPLGLSLALAVAGMAFPKRRHWFLWPFLVLSGATLLTFRTAVLSPVDLRTLVGDEPRLLVVRGRLAETPSVRVFVDQDGIEHERALAGMHVESLVDGESVQPACGEVLITSPVVPGPEFFAGRRVEMRGVVQRPRPALAEGLFDYRRHLGWLGIHYLLTVDSPADWSLADRPGETPVTPWSDRFLAWAQSTLATGLPEDEPLRLLWAMTLGWRPALTQEVSQPFMKTGTMHIFAISGLHIALIAGILVAVLRVLQVPRGACGVVVIPLIWLYTAATGWQASAIRSTIMMSVIVCGWALRRPSDLLNSLAASGLIILLWDPRQLFQASFQLSFFVVLSIALIMPLFQQLGRRLLETDPLLPASRVPRWRRWLGVPVRWLSMNLAVSLAAWLGSLPIVAYYFHLVTPVSLLANLIVVPASSLALTCNLGAITCGTWLPWATELFNQSAWFWMRIMVWVCEVTSAWPGAYFYVRSPSAGSFVVYYLLLVGVGGGWLLRPARRAWLVGALGLGILWFGGEWMLGRGVTEVTLLPLPGGGAQWIDAPGSDGDVLVDCSDKYKVEPVVRPFLRAQGVGQLRHWAVTHGDVQHVGGWRTVLAEFNPRDIGTSGVRFRSAEYRHLLTELERNPARWRCLAPGARIGCLTVVYPPASSAPEGPADRQVLVAKGTPGGVRLLLLSDLDPAGQRALLDMGADVAADVVVAGLPAQGEPLGDPLLRAIRPQVVIVNDAPTPLSARAGRTLRRRLEAGGARVWFTGEAGSLTLRFADGHWQLRTVGGLLGSGVAAPR